MINVDYPDLLQLFPQHLAPASRSESASFLMWYLEKYYRLDRLDAVDSVCDQRGDRGIDGIFVNDNDQTITVFQARISQRVGRTIGDSSLREFAGTLTQFSDPDSVKNLIDTAGSPQLAALAKRIDLLSRLATHDIRGEFVANVEIDQNGADFLRNAQSIKFVGRSSLISTYISQDREIPENPAVSFDIAGFSVTEYIVDATTRAVIAPVRAIDLVINEWNRRSVGICV